MLESVVARLLNQLLGKYVVDLDTENLNVGIFSGHVQLTDLQLKAEALYELNLPIKVKIGTIGKIWLKIPWNYLWNEPVVLTIEDILITAVPIVSYDKYDPEIEKRLSRAVKRKILNDLDTDRRFIGGPNSFSEHLLTNLVNNLQINVSNIHIRYEDSVSANQPLACGLCIGSITAETTNSKWKASKATSSSETCYYLIKVEALSVYWNPQYKTEKWDIPSQYYQWRNVMSNSLQNFSMNNQDFEFVVKPMTSKVKMTINRSDNRNITKIFSDIVIQDCNIQFSQRQFQSIFTLMDALDRMFISWNFLSLRPKHRISENKRSWWKYAYQALLEQRVRPYTWSRIKKVRQQYKEYTEAYKKILLNPNDTELKLDLQKYEDLLSIVNIVISRQQAALLVRADSFGDKNFWSMLPSPERAELCAKIGYSEQLVADKKQGIEHKHNFRIGNVSLSLLESKREVFVLTMTQFILSTVPNFEEDTYKFFLKIEGIVVEGASLEEHLVPIISSEHIHSSPAYFFKIDIEKHKPNSNPSFSVNGALSTTEVVYQEHAFNELGKFISSKTISLDYIYEFISKIPQKLINFVIDKVGKHWSFNFDIKVPYLVWSQSGVQKVENILVADLGHLKIETELCEKCDISEISTPMELEEQLYSRLIVNCNEMQILFCSTAENWKDARKERDSDMHLLQKLNFSSTFAISYQSFHSIPRYKWNVTMPSLKINLSEKKISSLVTFFNNFTRNGSFHTSPFRISKLHSILKLDRIVKKIRPNYLQKVKNSVRVGERHIKYKMNKIERNGLISKDGRKNDDTQRKENMNEAWARVVDLPGLEDNTSPSNNILKLFRIVINDFSLAFSRSSDVTERPYLLFRLGSFMMDVAFMTYGPAYQISINSILLTDKLYTTRSGQYLDLIYSPVPSTADVLTILYRRVDANCPDFWTHFHGVETSLVADLGTLNLLLHQDALHTILKYSRYMCNKISKQTSSNVIRILKNAVEKVKKSLQSKQPETPVPPGAVKFSHSAHLSNLKIRVCDSDFDIINISLSGIEMDFLFRANERFVFRSYLNTITVEHLSDGTLYSKVISTDGDKVYEIKYVRHAANIMQKNDISPSTEDLSTDGSFKFQLGRIHITFLYKLIVQLQRFILNLEGVAFVRCIVHFLRTSLNRATDTMKGHAKINLSINIQGPVLLFPQKSDSPNVIVFDTGELNIENFFKEYTTERIENILIKLKDITVLRGIMTLTSSLEMQETMVEPVHVQLDVKHFISHSKSVKKLFTWDIDGALDVIQITLGQRDLSIILAVYVDNIGEGKLIDLIPTTIKTYQEAIENDDTVKTLEAFFCEPKQKDISLKFSVDAVKVLLFFDSGELLSSPIRDLNHGLCKFEISDILTSLIIFTDKSFEGKLSIDSLLIEELGPDANIYDKEILHSPVDSNKNNNCNITVNKPPIIDITFHQNKTEDKTIDIIVGRLSLCLSVPLCEKIALFVLECLPRENIDLGIINHGYIGDIQGDNGQTSPHKGSSITVALRVNKPEFIFLIETTSNKKRYFITKAEILSDYSRHSSRLNLTLSLSGFHTLFYDLGLNTSTPYVVLKRCDVEFSKTCTEVKGEKITMTVSSLCVQLCSGVVHSINDILNDIIDHFKIPELPLEIRKSKSKLDSDDLWEPKKLNDIVTRVEDDYEKISTKDKIHELILFPKTEVVVVFELDEIPVIVFKSTIEMTVCDWSSLLNSTCEITIQANYYNESLQTWEPVIDPVVANENNYVPWDIMIKVFQDKALPILNTADNKVKKDYSKTRKASPSPSSTEDDESKDGMVYLQPPKMYHKFNSKGIKTSLSTFLDETDSENEDGAMEKLASAISDLFTGDWNESEESDYDHSSDAEDESEDNLDSKLQSARPSVELTKRFKKSTYFLIDTKESLNITITPAFLKVLNEIFTVYSSKTLSIMPITKSINLLNDIGPKTVVELYESKGTELLQEKVLVHSKAYENEESCPNSPTKTVQDFIEESNDDRDSLSEELLKLDLDLSYDYELTDTLQFPITTSARLYEKIHRHFLKIHIPGFLPLQTNCPKKNWQKFIPLQSSSHNKTYYLIAKHNINKHGRTVVVSSPLQIRNETCFALSVLYQPSILQQLNLEPVGDVMNPFETTMRITVLEPHEHYNVPLYIAYHCKLFIQPAYAEGHYMSETGLWWKDLATELDMPHHITCKPKSTSNLEVFALKVLLNRNVDVRNSHLYASPNYVIRLLPPLAFQNLLPYTLEVQNIELKQQMKVEPGEKSSIYSIDLSKDQRFLVKVSYSGFVWTGLLNVTADFDEKIIMLSTDAKSNGTNKQLPIHVKIEKENNYNIFFYASYWIVNKTELPLQLKATSNPNIFESTNEDILLFSFKRHTKQSITLRVYESNWSNDFGLDCAGTTGLVVCKDHERKKRYSLLLSIRLSEMCPQYTKVVTFLPSFIIINSTRKHLRFMEHNEKTDLWVDLPPNQHKLFWPETGSMEMYVKYRDSKLNSQPFFIATVHHTVLRMDKGTAICVNVTGGTSGPFHVTFKEYAEGDAPILIKNMCADLFLKIQQQGQSPVTLLNPFTSLMYTWDDPIKPRQLLWNVYNNKGSGFFIDVFKDGYGEERINFHSVPSGSANPNKSSVESSSSEDSDTADSVKTTLNRKVRRDKIVVYWICYSDGLQKTLLFTQEQKIATFTMKSYLTRLCDVECLISMSGIGISIFGKNLKKEIAYVSVSDAPAVWEVNVGHKWKTLTLELASWIEDKYRLHYKKCQLKDYIHIDFEKMFMLKPFFAELRRCYNSAIYGLYRRSRNHQYLSVKVQSLQIDNKQSSSNDFVILHPTPSVNIKGTNPFIDLAVFKFYNTNVSVYKDIRLNVEQFYFHLESQLLTEVAELLSEPFKIKENVIGLYRLEIGSIHAPLIAPSKESEMWNTRIECLQISPITVQLNISSRNQSHNQNFNILFSNLFNYLFPLNASPYMPAEGVQHRVSPLELIDVKGSNADVFFEILQHLKSQFLQQYYSQVLGLQVLVNSYSVQSVANHECALKEYDKTANLLISGCRCLLGHVNMSPAALEQCVLETFAHQSIENTHRIRRHDSYHKTSTVPKSVTTLSKNFNTGVTIALSQLIAKHSQNGMHYDGEVFFRGTGKALFSLITRHPDDKSDNVQVAIEALRRACILGEPISIHQRLTRYCNPHLGLKPFCIYESMGNHLLESIANYKYFEDSYWAHAPTDKVGKSVIILSLQHIIRVNKCRLWGTWEVEWCLDLDDIISVPQIETKELVLNVRQDENKYATSTENLTICGDKETLMWLKEKIEQAIVVSMEDKSWTTTE
ncbi:hypothetical protein PPYR_14486 [Photinus pyralis]|uniref:UBA domain-containing protein n=2 Tax=Photinus pyralis TaxID=7054 RepID=A0A5N4A5E3_PHOPY|nr:vacuolar protein sorting-associated protein 13C-like [Photinus pyralis]KAB0792527.1 hypothetical protein PPYR_14486 [Photinus pyralis]